jgi:ABC-type Na+ efflux pump permease subunit
MKFINIAKKDFRKIIREKAFVFVIFSEFLVLSLSVMFASAITSVLTPSEMEIPRGLPVAVVGDDNFLNYLSEAGFTVQREDIFSAMVDYNNNRYAAVIVAENFSNIYLSTEPVKISIYMPEDMRAFILLSNIKKKLKELEVKIREERIKQAGEEVLQVNVISKNPEKKPLPVDIIYGILLPLLIISIAVMSGNLVINLVTNEIENKTYDTLLSSPIDVQTFVYGKTLVSMFLALLQIIMVIVILNMSRFTVSNPAVLIVLVMSYTLILISIAVISSAIAKTRDNAQNLFALFLFPFVAMILPFSFELISKIGFLINLMPIYLMASLASGNVNFEVILGVIITAVISVILFVLSCRVFRRVSP